MLITEVCMDKDTLKKLIAGLCITTLISGAALMGGCAKKESTG